MRALVLALTVLGVIVPAMAAAQDVAASSSMGPEAVGAVVASVVVALVGGGAAGQWRAGRASPDLGALGEQVAELRRDLRALADVVTQTREGSIRAATQMEGLAERIGSIGRVVERIEEASRASR